LNDCMTLIFGNLGIWAGINASLSGQ